MGKSQVGYKRGGGGGGQRCINIHVLLRPVQKLGGGGGSLFWAQYESWKWGGVKLHPLNPPGSTLATFNRLTYLFIIFYREGVPHLP